MMEQQWLEKRMEQILDRRAQKGSLRIYNNNNTNSSTPPQQTNHQVDISSNDYLGLARDKAQQELVESRYQDLLNHNDTSLGSTGSRLLSGDSQYARQLELRLAVWHNRPAALLFNSGYDANLAVVSCLPCDSFLFDEYAHNSLRMGMKLSSSKPQWSFSHNNVDDLQNKLQFIQQQRQMDSTNQTLIVVESVYSMDGDVAPLQAILDLAFQHGALVLVDEAHGLGIMGDDRGNHSRGVGALAQLQLERHPALACSVHTFGKAAGCHGAVVCGSKVLRHYLWNYGWPLVYSTSLPLHSLVAIECSYETMTSSRGKELREHVYRLVRLFRQLVRERILERQIKPGKLHLLPAQTPIQALVIAENGNQACTEFCERVWNHSHRTIRLYPIKSPTVPAGMERVRIILHGHNTEDQLHTFVECMCSSLMDMNLVERRSKL